MVRGCDLDVPLAVLLGAGGVDLAAGVGAGASWEQGPWRGPCCSASAYRSSSPANSCMHYQSQPRSGPVIIRRKQTSTKAAPPQPASEQE